MKNGEPSIVEFTLDTLVTVCAAAFLFWRFHSSSESVRRELKGDILRVEKKSEDAHKELQILLRNIEVEQFKHTACFSFIEKRLNIAG